MTVPTVSSHPVERAAHRLGLALVAWSDRRTEHGHTEPLSRSAHRLAFAEQSALEARHRSWEQLASGAPRVH